MSKLFLRKYLTPSFDDDDDDDDCILYKFCIVQYVFYVFLYYKLEKHNIIIGGVLFNVDQTCAAIILV